MDGKTKIELLEELEEKFKEIEKELKLKVSLEEIDKIFSIKELVLERRYVSDRLEDWICKRICRFYFSWIEHLHNLILPPPTNLLAMTESKSFKEEEKKEIMNLIKKSMALISKNSILELTNDNIERGKFIENAVRFWNEEFNPKVLEIMKKINEKWSE